MHRESHLAPAKDLRIVHYALCITHCALRIVHYALTAARVAGLPGCWVAGLLGCWVAGVLGLFIGSVNTAKTALHGLMLVLRTETNS